MGNLSGSVPYLVNQRKRIQTIYFMDWDLCDQNAVCT